MPENVQPEQPDSDEQAAAGAAAETANAEARLKELQDQLQKQEAALAASIEAREAEVASKKSKRDALKTAVESQTALVDDIKKTGAGYGKGLEALQKDVKDLNEYLQKKTPMIDAALGENKPKVEEKIVGVEKKIEDQGKAVKKAADDADTARTEAEAAQKEMNSKQDDFNKYKQLASEISANIQKMKDFRSKIEENDDPPRPASMYVYLRESKTVIGKTKVPTQADFDKELNARWKALDTAKENDRDKKLAW